MFADVVPVVRLFFDGCAWTWSSSWRCFCVDLGCAEDTEDFSFPEENIGATEAFFWRCEPNIEVEPAFSSRFGVGTSEVLASEQPLSKCWFIDCSGTSLEHMGLISTTLS